MSIYNTKKIKIEADIAIPAKYEFTKTYRSWEENELIRTIEDMEIGDSFIVPEYFITIEKHRGSGKNIIVNRNMYHFFKRAGKKCSIRKIGKNGKNNIFRCWRVA